MIKRKKLISAVRKPHRKPARRNHKLSASIPVEVTAPTNPWLKFAGTLKDDPDVKEAERIIDREGDNWVAFTS